jgi:hypothetical protein
MGGIEFKVLACWNMHFAKNSLRDFLFRFVQNSLSVNARIAHLVENVSPNCHFCSRVGRFLVQGETFLHLFFQCPFVEKLHNDAGENFWPEIVLDNEEEQKIFWFLGVNPLQGARYNNFLQIAIGTVQFYIWQCKIKKTTISWDACRMFTVENLRAMTKVSPKLTISKII